MLQLFDPMIRMILAAIALATLLPVSGAAKDAAQAVSNTAVFTLFLLHGLKLERAEVVAGLGNVRLIVPLLLWVFGIMAMGGWSLWHITADALPPTIALGFLYLGCLPSTVQAAVSYSSLAGGNRAASVVVAALTNIMGVFITAPLFSLLAGSHGAAFHSDTLVKVFGLLVVPFVLGQWAQKHVGGWVKTNRTLVNWLDRGAISIAIYVGFSGAVTQGLWHKLDPSAWGTVLAACAALLMLGYGGTWLLGRALSLSREDRITLLYGGAHKSAAMGVPLAAVLFPAVSAGAIIVPLLAYHLSQLIVAAPIAAKLAGNRPDA